jgi:nickel-dependent lactate racemase
MSLYCSAGGIDCDLTPQLPALLTASLEKLGSRKAVLAVPPDQTRIHSRAGDLTWLAWQFYGERLKAVLPALGTHAPMRPEQIDHMFGPMPHDLFKVHRWREDVETLGEIPASFIHEQSEGRLNYSWPVQVNKLVCNGGFDLILSIGQVVPHEVIGMANYNKNLLVGTGGPDSINRSHYLGAVYGMERIMGRADTPVRRVLNYASDIFLRDVPVVYVLTVIQRKSDGQLAVCGLFVGDDIECFHLACELSLKTNFEVLSEPLQRAVVYLDPREFHSTWLGNKAIYRTRMALADGADLFILAPGVDRFGEDNTIDHLIRKYGYCGTPETIRAVEQHPDLAANLGAAAHLIHGSSEGRFNIIWSPGKLSRSEIEGVGYEYCTYDKLLSRYDPTKLRHGFNRVEGQDVFFIANPGLGLWSSAEKLLPAETEIIRTKRDSINEQSIQP